MSHAPVFLVNSATHIAALAVHLLCQGGKESSRSTGKPGLHILVDSSETDGCSKLIVFEFAGVQLWARLLAQMTIDTHRLIDLWIPEAFVVSMKRYALFGTNVHAGITTAAVFFLLNIYHILFKWQNSHHQSQGSVLSSTVRRRSEGTHRHWRCLWSDLSPTGVWLPAQPASPGLQYKAGLN